MTDTPVSAEQRILDAYILRCRELENELARRDHDLAQTMILATEMRTLVLKLTTLLSRPKKLPLDD